LPSLELVTDHCEQSASLSLHVDQNDQSDFTVLHWQVKHDGDSPFVGVVRLQLNAPMTCVDPWLMVPAHRIGRPDHEYMPNVETGVWLDIATDRTALPGVFINEANQCFATVSDPTVTITGEWHTDAPDLQVGLGWRHKDEQFSARISIPACEEPITQSCSPLNGPTINRVHLQPGAAVKGVLYVYHFQGDRHGYHRIMRDSYYRLKAQHPRAELQDTLPIVRDAADGIALGHYTKQGRYFIYGVPFDPIVEQIVNSRGTTSQWHQMQIGFANGFVVCRSLLYAAKLLDDDSLRKPAVDVAEHICTEGISPSGLFWADYMPEKIQTINGEFANPMFKDRKPWGTGWIERENCVHSRTIADACLNLTLMILNEPAGSPHRAMWLKALRSNLDTILSLQEESGGFGQLINAQKKRIEKSDGCGGIVWITTCLHAAQLFADEPKYVEQLHTAALRGAEHYAKFVEDEYIWGGPSDNDTGSSEDGMNALMAYAALYRQFGDEKYLSLSRNSAEWMLTFRMCFNALSPKGSILDQYKLRTVGGDFASTGNAHLHVFEVLVTEDLCDLTRWTGDEYFRDRALDHWTYSCQLLSRSPGMFNSFRGAMAEQRYWSNWSTFGQWTPPPSHSQKGMIASFSTVWCQAVLLLAAPQVMEALDPHPSV